MTIHHADPWLTIHGGDCRDVLATLPDASVHCVVTSPPYWGLRDYGTATWEGGDPACDHAKPVENRNTRPLGSFHGGSDAGNDSREKPYRDRCGKCGAVRVDRQLGLEATPEAYVANMVAVFREVRRVLRDDGTLWINLGDSYASDLKGSGGPTAKQASNAGAFFEPRRLQHGLKPKDLVGIPWRVAFALQADGWYLRSDIIWAKPNPMPESVTDRPTKAHEYLFLLTKSPRYFYDAEAVKEPVSPESDFGKPRPAEAMSSSFGNHRARLGNGSVGDPAGRNRRSVWYNDEREALHSVQERPTAGPVLSAEGATLWDEPVQSVLGAPGTGESDDTGGAGAQAADGRTVPNIGEGEGRSAAAGALRGSTGAAGGIPGVGGRQGGAATGEQDGEGAGPSGTLLREPEGAGGTTPQAPVGTRQGARRSATAQAADDIGGPVGGHCCGVGSDQDGTRRPVCLLPSDAAVDDGPRPTPEPWRPAHAGECCGCVSELQQQQEGADAGGLGRRLTDLWTVATQPYPGAHFAVMPEALVEPCILAGTSERGVCPECGAPWERVVERVTVRAQSDASRAGAKMAGRRDQGLVSAKTGLSPSTGQPQSPIVTTTGWRPTCDHAAEPVPAVCLDPFGGSGTVARVANRLSRRAILIDLNPDYLAQQLERNRDMPLGLTA